MITFDSNSASTTALLLSGSNIDGSVITVVAHTEDTLQQHQSEERAAPPAAAAGDIPAPQQSDEDILAAEMASLHVSSMPQEDIPVRAQETTVRCLLPRSLHQRTVELTFCSLLPPSSPPLWRVVTPWEPARSLQRRASMVRPANPYPRPAETDLNAEERGITSTVSETVTTGTGAIKERTKQLDEQYHISEQAAQLGDRVSHSLSEFEEQYHVMETTNAGLAVAAAKVNEWGDVVSQGIQSAIEAPSVQSTWASLKSWGSNLATSVATAVEPATTAVSREINEIKTVTEARIDEKMVEQGFEAPSAAKAAKQEQEMVDMAAAATADDAAEEAKELEGDFAPATPLEHELFDSEEQKKEAPEAEPTPAAEIDAEEVAQMHELEDEVFSDPLV